MGPALDKRARGLDAEVAIEEVSDEQSGRDNKRDAEAKREVERKTTVMMVKKVPV